MDRKWIENGQKMDRKWIENGQKMDRKWIENGWKMDRKWRGTSVHHFFPCAVEISFLHIKQQLRNKILLLSKQN